VVDRAPLRFQKMLHAGTLELPVERVVWEQHQDRKDRGVAAVPAAAVISVPVAGGKVDGTILIWAQVKLKRQRGAELEV
jgi:hypothetical protein